MMKTNNHLTHVINIIIILCGFFGIVGNFISSLVFPNNTYFYMLVLMVIAVLFYCLYLYNKKVGMITLGLQVLIGIYLFVFQSINMNIVIRQLRYIIDNDDYLNFEILYKNAGFVDEIFYFFLFLFITLPIIYLIVSLIKQKKLVLLKLLLLQILFIFPALIKHPLLIIEGYVFVIFFIYAIVNCFLIKDQKLHISHQVIILLSTACILLFSHQFLENNPIFKKSSFDVITNFTNWISDNQWNEWFHIQNSTGLNSSINGTLPNGNISIDGKIALKVKSDKRFTGYLRGYSLANYTNNQWQPVGKDFKDSHSTELFSTYASKNVSDYEVASVEIETMKNTKYQLVPYYPNFTKPLTQDSYYKNVDSPISIRIIDSIFKVPGVMNDMNSYVFEDDYRYYLNDDDEYYEYVLKEYMNVPNNLRKKFDKAFKNEKIEQGKTDLYSMVMEIASYLTKYTEYDLKAGTLPANKDFVEYFLFENQKGSCTHYATSVALLLRYMGVPTRYVSGFAISESDFDVNNEAIIKNNRAHAWTEVYIKGVGWVPIDLTPSSNMDLTKFLDQSLKDKELGLDDEEKPFVKPLNPLNPKNPETILTPEEIEEEKLPWYQPILEYKQYLITITGIALLIVGYRFGKRYYFILKLKKSKNNQKVILYYQRMLLIDRDKIYLSQEVKDLAYKAKFSQHFLVNSDVKFVENELKIIQEKVYHILPWYKKILYKYILCYM